MMPQGRVLKGQRCLPQQLGLHLEDKREQQMCFKSKGEAGSTVCSRVTIPAALAGTD